MSWQRCFSRAIRVPERDIEMKDRAAARRIVKAKSARVLGHDLGDDIETQSRANFLLHTVGLGLLEFTENA